MSDGTRILTTHVGSLPRPQDVVDVVFADDRGEHVDPDRFEQVIRDAVADRVRHQVEAGIDVVSDGEMSKIGYATYIRHRLSGFEVGDVPRATPADLDAYPRFRDRLAQAGGSAKYLRPICRGPITYEHPEPLQQDLAHLKAAIDGQPVAGAFMNAPSPGIIALFQPNEYYDTLDEYLDAIGEAMKHEYEAIVAAGVQLQIDAPDLAMGRHIMYRDRSDEEFVAERRAPRRGDQPGASRHPRRPRAAAHLLGQLRGTPPPRHRPAQDRRRDPAGQAGHAPVRGRQPAPRPRLGHLARRQDPRRQGARPGRTGLDHQLHRAPRAGGPAAAHLRRDRWTGAGRRGTDCGFGTWAGFGAIDPDICWAKMRSLSQGAQLASGRA